MSSFEKWTLRKKNLWINILLILMTYFAYLVVYLFVLFKNKEYYEMTRNPEKYADKRNLRCFHSKIVGVTFKNENGTSRQDNLKKIGHSDELNLVIYEYKPGEEAIGVYYKNRQLGNVAAELVDELKEIIRNNKLISVIAEPTGSNGKTRGCNISIICEK